MVGQWAQRHGTSTDENASLVGIAHSYSTVHRRLNSTRKAIRERSGRGPNEPNRELIVQQPRTGLRRSSENRANLTIIFTLTRCFFHAECTSQHDHCWIEHVRKYVRRSSSSAPLVPTNNACRPIDAKKINPPANNTAHLVQFRAATFAVCLPNILASNHRLPSFCLIGPSLYFVQS